MCDFFEKLCQDICSEVFCFCFTEEDENEKNKTLIENKDATNIITQSKSMQSVLEHIKLAGPSEATVLILGESGTGKELVARALHRSSKRNMKPLIVVNCAAIPPSIIESELFGHETRCI